MKKKYYKNIFLTVCLFTCGNFAPLAVTVSNADPLELNRYFIEAASRAKQSVVNIIIYNKTKKNGRYLHSRVGYASGTIISKRGYLVTNYHVVQKGNYFQIILHDGTECELVTLDGNKFFIADAKTDIAIMKIDKSETDLRPLPFGDSQSLAEGEWVLAIGNPYGLRQSISSGIVSSKGRNDIGFADIEDFIQTDVPINPGNSGGPLINLRAEMVGINTAIRTVTGAYQGISFAIPSNIVKQVCAELIHHNRVRRGWLGFIAHDRRLKNSNTRIVKIISVIKNSPASRTGIRIGDIIREINGKKILTLGELVNIVGNKKIGSKLDISVSRNGKLYLFNLILREKRIHKHLLRSVRKLYMRYGIEVDENSQTREVMVSYLSPMGIAYQKGLKKGDIILSLNGKKIFSIEDFFKIFFRNKKNIREIEIFRGSRQFTVDISDTD